MGGVVFDVGLQKYPKEPTVGIDQSNLLPQCNANTTKCGYRKRSYSSNGLILAFLGATTMFLKT